jgi:hypothetical protein
MTPATLRRIWFSEYVTFFVIFVILAVLNAPLWGAFLGATIVTRMEHR